MMNSLFRFALAALLPFACQLALAATPGEFTEPPAVDSNEPFAEAFSRASAREYLDNATAHWQEQRKCVTCHTNGMYLVAVSKIDPESPRLAEVDRFAHEKMKGHEEKATTNKKARPPIERIVTTAAFLAISDLQRSGELASATREALDFVWTLQNDKGCWDRWPKCNWPPYEVDDYFPVILMSMAVGMASAEYQQSAAAADGIKGLRKFLAANPPTNDHQATMKLWASNYLDGLLDAEQRAEIIARVSEQQQDDGGWNLAVLGGWDRADKNPKITAGGDGYATGMVLYVLRESGVAADDPRITRGIAWLKSNQRESGRWYTRSPSRDNRHYITNAGTAFGLMALAVCDEE